MYAQIAPMIASPSLAGRTVIVRLAGLLTSAHRALCTFPKRTVSVALCKVAPRYSGGTVSVLHRTSLLSLAAPISFLCHCPVNLFVLTAENRPYHTRDEANDRVHQCNHSCTSLFRLPTVYHKLRIKKSYSCTTIRQLLPSSLIAHKKIRRNLRGGPCYRHRLRLPSTSQPATQPVVVPSFKSTLYQPNA